MAIDGLVGHTGLMKPALLFFALALGAGCGSEKDPPPPKSEPQPPEGSNESRQHLFEKDNLDQQVIEQAVRRAIEKSEGDLTEADLWQVTGLDFTSQNLTNLGPLAGLKELAGVNLVDNPITHSKAGQLQKALPKCEVKHNLQP